MSEIERYDESFETAYAGDSWHGPSLSDTVAGVGWERAAARPLESAHSIWEIVTHLAVWQREVTRRLAGEPYRVLPPEEDWPPVPPPGPAGWGAALDELEASRRALREALAAFPAAKLDRTVPGRPHTYAAMIEGVIHHAVYHAGQISLLRKAGSGAGR